MLLLIIPLLALAMTSSIFIFYIWFYSFSTLVEQDRIARSTLMQYDFYEFTERCTDQDSVPFSITDFMSSIISGSGAIISRENGIILSDTCRSVLKKAQANAATNYFNVCVKNDFKM